MTPRGLCVAAALGACSKPADSRNVAPAAPPAAGSAPSAVATGSGSADHKGATMQPALAIKLLAAPTQLAMAARDRFMIGVEVTNRGPVTVDPQLSDCEL